MGVFTGYMLKRNRTSLLLLTKRHALRQVSSSSTGACEQASSNDLFPQLCDLAMHFQDLSVLQQPAIYNFSDNAS